MSQAPEALALLRREIMRRRMFAGEMTGKEAQLVEEVFSAILDGKAKLSGKRQDSFRQYWGRDYARKQRMLARVRKRHPGLSEILKRASQYGSRQHTPA